MKMFRIAKQFIFLDHTVTAGRYHFHYDRMSLESFAVFFVISLWIII